MEKFTVTAMESSMRYMMKTEARRKRRRRLFLLTVSSVEIIEKQSRTETYTLESGEPKLIVGFCVTCNLYE